MLAPYIMDIGSQKTIIIGLITAIIIGSGVYFYSHFLIHPQTQEDGIKIKVSSFEGESRSVLVHVAGEVKREGVYKLKSSDRVLDAIAQAGGARSSADLSRLNLAEKLKDGQKITVLQRSKSTGSVAAAAGKRISVNNASEKDLDTLPGVGPATANGIIEGRPYSKLEDLAKVPRIGKKKFEKIKDRICL